jgi:hypothetical protein
MFLYNSLHRTVIKFSSNIMKCRKIKVLKVHGARWTRTIFRALSNSGISRCNRCNKTSFPAIGLAREILWIVLKRQKGEKDQISLLKVLCDGSKIAEDRIQAWCQEIKINPIFRIVNKCLNNNRCLLKGTLKTFKGLRTTSLMMETTDFKEANR